MATEIGDVGDTGRTDLRVDTGERPRNPDGTFKATETPAEPANPSHPSWLTSEARTLGFSDEDMAGYTTPTLALTVNRMLKHQVNLRTQLAAERTRTDAAVTPPPPAPPPEEEIDLGVDLSEFDPKLQQAIKTAARLAMKKNEGLAAEVAAERQARQQREIVSDAEALDEAFEALGPDFEPLFGKGGSAELADTPEMKRRVAVLFTGKIPVVNVNRRKIKQQVKEIVDLLYPSSGGQSGGKPAAKPADNPYAANGGRSGVTPEDWNAAALARPTNREPGPEPKGEKLALKNLERRIRESQQAAAAGDGETLDGLLS